MIRQECELCAQNWCPKGEILDTPCLPLEVNGALIGEEEKGQPIGQPRGRPR